MCKHSRQAPHTGEQDDANIRPKQLRNREVPWEGSHRSKLMSRRTERSYKADGTDKLAPLSEVRCLVPEVNDPVAQQEFTFLLREICAFRHGGNAEHGDSRGSLWKHRSQPRP